VTTSLVIFVFAVFGVKWLEKGNESRREVLSLARNTASERILGSESARADALLQNKDELWSVQVGAFRSEQDAVKLAASLKIKGYEAHVIRGELNAVNLYRAKVGRFGTREEAERLLRVLKDKEAYRTAFVVRM
jgi:cell division protein FtsN